MIFDTASQSSSFVFSSLKSCFQSLRDLKTVPLILLILIVISFFALLFYFFSYVPRYSNKRRVVRRQKTIIDQSQEGKRSARLRLKNHELVFIERITEEEFERQKTGYTGDQVAKLQESVEYKKMLKKKGKKLEQWNWQAWDAKYGHESEVSSQYDIVSQYAHSSDDDAKSVGKMSVRSKGRIEMAPTKRAETTKPKRTTTKKVKIIS